MRDYIEFNERMSVYMGMKLGLGRIKYILNLLNNPQDKLEVIHIAGTNGKGSTATFISEILLAEGYKVGIFISPTMLGYREYIGGVNVSYEQLHNYLDLLENIYKVNNIELKNQLTEFETMVVISILHFVAMKVDYSIIEVGLGGLEDATNIFKRKLLNVITSISLDHTQLLGNNIKDIASRKLGIIQPKDMTFILEEEDSVADILSVVNNKNISYKLIKADYRLIRIVEKSQYFEYKDKIYKINQSGLYQINNAILSINVAAFLHIGYESVLKGLENMRMKCRLEWINDTILLDGSHNPQGIKAFMEYIETFNDKKISIIFGILRDKSYKEVIKLLSNIEAKFYLVNVPFLGREMNLSLLKEEFDKMNISSEIVGEPKEALMKANKDGTDIIVVTGSLYLARELRKVIIEDRDDIN